MGLAAKFLVRLRDLRFVRYLAVSIGALAVDLAVFLALLRLGTGPATASAAGYSLGILAHWLMSSRAVFQEDVACGGLARSRQKALFVLSAVLGLVLTTVIVALGEWVRVDPKMAKAIAIVISFAAIWMVRSRIVFRTAAPRSASTGVT